MNKPRICSSHPAFSGIPANDHAAVLNPPSSRVQVFPFASQAAAHAADRIQEVIRRRASEGRLALLAIDLTSIGDTGNTPDAIHLVLAEVAQRVQVGTMSLANVAAIPVWDWWPAGSTGHSRSAHLRHILQTRTDICGANIWSLEAGERQSLGPFCTTIENRIAELGGIDLVLLSARPDCQLGQNEIDGWIESRTRLVFAMDGEHPRRAITLGVSNLREAASLILIGTGGDHADSMEYHANDHVNTLLDKATLIADRAAATSLPYIGFPWRVAPLADVGRTWDDLTIAHASIAESCVHGLAFHRCPELYATFGGVAPNQDPGPALHNIAHSAIRGSVNPLGWKRVLIVSRDAQAPSRELPGMLRAISEQLVTVHTVCLHGAPSGSHLYTTCPADTLAAWKHCVTSAINTHKPDHIIAIDDVSGLLSQASLESSAGQPIQVLFSRHVNPWQFQWIWPSPALASWNECKPGLSTALKHIRDIIGTDRELELLGLVH